MEKEALQRYFIEENHTLTECASFYNCSISSVRRNLKKFGIKKVQEKEIDKETLSDYYLNHTVEETLSYFNISRTCLFSKLRKYDIKKPKESYSNHKRKYNVNKEDIIHFYIVMNYTETETARVLKCSPRLIRRRISEYGIKKDKEKRYENVSASCLRNNGVKSPAKLEKVKEKIRNTNNEKYGVPYACMREEYHKFKGSDSSINIEFSKKLDKLGIEYEREFHLENYLYDFKVNDILIEIDPTITHNSTKGIFNDKPKDKNYHLNKTIAASKYGYHCIHIFDWDNEEKIINLFLTKKKQIYARECKVLEVDKDTSNVFLDNYHLQGHSRGNVVNVGLVFDNDLVGLMTFGKPRYNRNYQWELLRLCFSETVIGGAEKMFKYFEKEYEPKNILSYCDLSKFSGKVYEKLGFVLLNKSKPSKHWCNLKDKRKHITDNLLRQKGFDNLFDTNYGKGTSNSELMLKSGYVIVYDCGQLTYAK